MTYSGAGHPAAALESSSVTPPGLRWMRKRVGTNTASRCWCRRRVARVRSVRGSLGGRVMMIGWAGMNQAHEPVLSFQPMFDENSNSAAVVASPSNAAMMSQLLQVKDSRWLQLEVCREFQRGQCSRSDQECKFAHPPPHVDVQNGRVTACYDSIKGRCTRENPKCKYLHPPQHLKDQLLINGRNNLALKNLLCSQLNQPSAAAAAMTAISPLAQLVVSAHYSSSSLLQQQQQQQQQQAVAAAAAASLVPTLPYHYYQGMTGMFPGLMSSTAAVQAVQAAAAAAANNEAFQSMMLAGSSSQTGTGQSPVAGGQNKQRDRVEQQLAVQAQLAAAAHMAAAERQRKRPLDSSTDDLVSDPSSLLFAAAVAANAVPSKRAALEKSGVPMYQPATVQYLVPGLHGYMPVSFAGQLPPRF